MSIVPTFSDLSFYSTPLDHTARYQQLSDAFTKEYNADLDFIARSPGRVNLFGDHIDYNFFPVLPMAIEVDVICGVKTDQEQRIILSNTDSQFKQEVIDLPKDGSVVKIDKHNFSWGNYFKCGLIVAHKYILEKNPQHKLKGMKLMFNGTVPTGGGLSSSAAFCVSSTLAVLHANGISITKDDLTRITVVSEHYVGVNTGGMDQCASIYGEQQQALLIEFKPKLRGIPFRFPQEDVVFLITNSLQIANKHETAPVNYNLRVVEMAIASDLLAHRLKLSIPQDSNLNTGSLRGVMDGYFGAWDGTPQTGIDRLSKLLELTEEIFSEDEKIGFSKESAAKVLGLDDKQFFARYLNKFPVQFDKLKLYQRTRHVYFESRNVLECLILLKGGDSDSFLSSFGTIMNKSHKSLDVYHNSSNEKLNAICEIALKNGSYGSRVTGAGWGGSVVHLTDAKNLQKLVNALTEEYYKVEFKGIGQEELAEAIVVSKPAAGSCVIEKTN